MTIKRFLVPVLALTAFGLPAGASVVAYCDGGGCGANTTAAFSSLIVTDNYTYASATDLTFVPGDLSGGAYSDPMTSLMFAASGAFTVSGTTLQEATGNTITINVGASYAVVRLALSQVSGGSAYTYLDSDQNTYTYLSSAATEVDFVNTAPGSAWVITVMPSFSGEHIAVDSFNPAGGMTPSDTPEVGTLLLIGVGLISMRWMRRWPRKIFRTPQTA